VAQLSSCELGSCDLQSCEGRQPAGASSDARAVQMVEHMPVASGFSGERWAVADLLPVEALVVHEPKTPSHAVTS
jgi:hypothetical protein